MPLENDPQISIAQPMPLAPNGKGASSTTDPTYNVRMLMASENNALKELAMAKIDHLEETQKLHVSYQEKLTIAEAKRIDAILAAGVADAEANRERANSDARLLAAQVTSTAETMRALVASTANAMAIQFQQVTTSIIDRLAALEKARYEDVGKARVLDPQLTEFLKKVDVLVSNQDIGKGGKDQSSVSRNIIFAVIGAVVGVVGIGIGCIGTGIALFTFFSNLP